VTTGHVYYSRVASGGAIDGTIWQADGNGAEDIQVTTGEWPRLSPDGRYLIFIRDSASITYRGNLYVRDLQAGTETKIFSSGDYVVNYDWSGDGTRIFFDYVCSIDVMNADGSNVQGFVQGTDCYDDAPIVNPVDGGLAFHNAHVGILLANADGSGRRSIPNTVPGDQWPAWSPDGQWVSFIRYPAGDYFKIRPDGTGLTQLTFAGPGDSFGIARSWSADGSRLVVPGTLGGVAGLFAFATDGSAASFAIPVTTGATIDFVGSVRGDVAPP
jgi:Tol biopolymer transport system component